MQHQESHIKTEPTSVDRMLSALSLRQQVKFPSRLRLVKRRVERLLKGRRNK
jgi:hypothetical protein